MADAGSSLAKNLYLALRCSTFTLPWILRLFTADILLSALLPLSALFPTAAYNLSSHIADSVWRKIQDIFTRINGADIVVSGDELPLGESAIVVCNHVEWTDFYMIQELAIKAAMLGRCRWFAKQELKWVPFLGWGLWAMGMPLVSRKWTTDKRELDRVFHGVLHRHWPMWLISFAEATRFTPAKHAAATEWCSANGKSMPRHLLYPRTKGFVASVQQLRQAPHVRAVYDVTVAYAKGTTFMAAPSFWQSLTLPSLGKRWRFFVHVERHEMAELPDTDQELAQWLEDRWIEKGERLERLRVELVKGLSWTSRRH